MRFCYSYTITVSLGTVFHGFTKGTVYKNAILWVFFIDSLKDLFLFRSKRFKRNAGICVPYNFFFLQGKNHPTKWKRFFVSVQIGHSFAMYIYMGNISKEYLFFSRADTRETVNGGYERDLTRIYTRSFLWSLRPSGQQIF